jgi:hypothetical protein
MRAYKVTLFGVYAGDPQGFLGNLLGGLIGYRPRRRPRHLLCGNLVDDVKDHDEPVSDLRLALQLSLLEMDRWAVESGLDQRLWSQC